jgi:hypothetical protein
VPKHREKKSRRRLDSSLTAPQQQHYNTTAKTTTTTTAIMGFRETASSSLTYILHSILRLIQFVFALAVCGLYGVDLHAARKQGKYSDGKWVFAEVVGALSAFTALLYLVPFVARVPLVFAWDAVLFFLWIVLFGIFGNVSFASFPSFFAPPLLFVSLVRREGCCWDWANGLVLDVYQGAC